MRAFRYLVFLMVFFYMTLSLCALFCKKEYTRIKFINSPSIKPLKKYTYILAEPLLVKADKKIIAVPADFKTDLASIPIWCWFVISPYYTKLIYPAILHDYLYTCPEDLPRDAIDDIFYGALLSSGINQSLAFKMWLAVHLFGGTHFLSGNKC